MACTRGVGIWWPSSRSSAGSRCGDNPSIHGPARSICATALWIVKSVGTTPSRSSQASGNDTGTCGRTRGLYAAITVAPPTRVASTNTLPPRSSFMNVDGREVGIESRRPVPRSPGVAAAASSISTRRVDRHEDVDALGAARLHPADQADVVEHRPDQPRRAHGRLEAGALGWVEVEDEMRHAVGPVRLDQRRVVLDRALVAEPQQRPAVVAQRVRRPRASTPRPRSRRSAPSPARTWGRSSA